MSQKLKNTTNVTSVDSSALFYAVDLTRATNDRDVNIKKSDLQNDLVVPLLPSGLPPIENRYGNISELLDNQGSQTEGFLQYVKYASEDPNVASGRAYYLKTDTTTGSLDDYIRQTDDVANALDAGQGKQTADCGTVIPLDTVYGHNCNMQSANSNTSYTVNNENLINSYARVKINASSEPTVSGATQQGGIGFVPNTDMILLVQNLGDAGLVYSFNSIGVNAGEADTLQTVTARGGLTDQNMQILSETPSFIVSESTTLENSYAEIAADINSGYLALGNSNGHRAKIRPLNMAKSVDITFAGEDGDLNIYSGTWNASTNSPTLANTDTGVKAVEYKVSVAGTQDFGAGNITFAVGDIVANDGTIWYKKVDNNQGGNLTLQEVTDNGNVTTNDITIGDGSKLRLSSFSGTWEFYDVFGPLRFLRTGTNTFMQFNSTELLLQRDTNVFSRLLLTSITSIRNHTLPDASGTLALTSDLPPKVFSIACSDEITDLETGTAKATFRMPYAMTLTEVRASVTTAPTDATIEVDINENGVSILSTVLSIDSGEKTSTTATTPAVISDTSLADDAEITIDIDQVGSTVAGTGLKITLIGT